MPFVPTFAAALALAGASPAGADPCLLDSHAAGVFNAGLSVQDRQSVPVCQEATRSTRVAPNPALAEMAAARFDAGVSVQDRHPAIPPLAAPDPDLDAMAIQRFNTGVSVQDRQI
jgi:hypothetical protein